MWRVWPSLAVVVICVANAAACSAGSGASGDDTVRVAAVASGPFTEQFNPLLTSSLTSSGYATEAIYEPLLMDDVLHGVQRPWLATSCHWDADGRSLTLTVRDGVKWSDGQPLTADDVAFTFDLLRKYKALNTNELPLAGATAPTATTAVITFTKPSYQTQWRQTPVVSKHVWASVPDPVKYANTNPVGSGPYALTSFTPPAITLRANPYYWQLGAPKVKSVRYLSYDSTNVPYGDWVRARAGHHRAIARRGNRRHGDHRVGDGVAQRHRPGRFPADPALDRRHYLAVQQFRRDLLPATHGERCQSRQQLRALPRPGRGRTAGPVRGLGGEQPRRGDCAGRPGADHGRAGAGDLMRLAPASS